MEGMSRSVENLISFPAVEKEFQVVYKDYGGKLVDHNALRLLSVATVKETGKMFSEDFELRLENKEDKVEIVVSVEAVEDSYIRCWKFILENFSRSMSQWRSARSQP